MAHSDAKELAYDERAESPTRFAAATADFNGDGRLDEALLLKSTTFSGEGLWVYLSGRKADLGKASRDQLGA